MTTIYSKAGTDAAISAATGALTPEDVGADPAGTAAEAVAALDLGTAAVADAADFAPASSAAYPVQQVTLTGNLAYTLPVDAPADQVISVVFTQDSTGGHTVTHDGQPVTVDLAAGASTLVEVWPGGTLVYPGASAPAGTVDWSDVTNPPATYAPSAHAGSHTPGQPDALTPASIGAATAAQGSKADTAIQPLATLARRTAAEVTQGLYSRVPASSSWRALALDTRTGYPWGVSSSGIQFYNGTALSTATASPNPAQSGLQMVFTNTHLYLVTTASTDRSGQVWRSPIPAIDGTGLAWTKIFDLTGFTTTLAGGIDGGVGSYFREQCFATDGTVAFVVEYGGTVTGGPSVYYTASVTSGSMLWTKRKTWANGKHAHSVKLIGTIPWVMIGDAGSTDLGLWRGTPNGGTWTQASIYGEDAGGTTLYGINILPVTIDGHPLILTENDTKRGHSVLSFNSQGTATLPILPFLSVPPPYQGTVRSLCLTSEGNLMWVQTGENGAVGPYDSVWIAKYPFTQPVLLEAIPSTNALGTLTTPVEAFGDRIYLGTWRIMKEKFVGQ